MSTSTLSLPNASAVSEAPEKVTRCETKEAPVSSCCPATEQATCCAPTEKAACCGPSAAVSSAGTSSCGCK